MISFCFQNSRKNCSDGLEPRAPGGKGAFHPQGANPLHRFIIITTVVPFAHAPGKEVCVCETFSHSS